MIFSFLFLAIASALNVPSRTSSFVETKATDTLPQAAYVVNDDDYPYQCVCRCAKEAVVGKCAKDSSLKCFCDI